MPDIFSYFRPYDSRNYRSVSGNTQPRQKSQPKPVTATWKPGDYSNTIFRRYVETGNPESFPTWSQFQWIYPHSTKADYESARANAPVRQQSAPVANPTPVNYSKYIPSSGTNYIMAGAPTPSVGRAAVPATDWDALHSRLGEPTAVDYMTVDGLSSDRNSTSRTATPPASTPRTGTAVAAKPGETVAAMWTRVTGLPWKTAKEMGLTDGSYAQNIEILKGLKSGRINKDYINGLANGEGVTTEEASYAPGAYTPTIAVPEARPFGYVPVQAEPRAMEPELRRADLPAGILYDGVDMTAPTEREANMAARGGIFGWDPTLKKRYPKDGPEAIIALSQWRSAHPNGEPYPSTFIERYNAYLNSKKEDSYAKQIRMQTSGIYRKLNQIDNKYLGNKFLHPVYEDRYGNPLFKKRDLDQFLPE